MKALTGKQRPPYLRRLPTVAIFSLIGLLTLLAVMVVTLYTVRSHGIVQQAIQTRDSAQALSVALRPFIPDASAPEEERQEQARRTEILLRALAQSGNYRELKLEYISGDTGLSYESLPATAGVPHWFTSFLAIEVPKYRAEITVGWDIAGFVSVSRQPAPLHHMLWQCAQGVLGTGLAGLILALILVRVRTRGFQGEPAQGAARAQENETQRMPTPVKTLPERAPQQAETETQNKNADVDHVSVFVRRDTCAEQVSDE
ncbi:LapD/MoxY N-terminal periplasmic domain-containing protein [Microbulbifer mangrovi]|uniref:LapD/MoxY N-terminal periplasmic domain-containing protein n=1 Tax=Microbulbifer mangrovi TaxID=927787 RepID=UPI000990416D|nr:LapD/MoxY N-terminal periplasmic domain-containing protein [Microbulbifer mangrovi]